jgi:hypothetical protein
LYNTERLHSALGDLRPIDYYRGEPQQLHEARRRKLAEARHQRREANLKVRQLIDERSCHPALHPCEVLNADPDGALSIK